MNKVKSRLRLRNVHKAVSVILAAAVAGCVDVEGDDAIVQHSAAILNGDTAWYDTHNVVQVQMTSLNMYCTGTLVTNSWVLTASECLEDDYGNEVSPSDVRVAHDVQIDSSTTYIQAIEIIRHPGTSASLLRLAQPISIENDTRAVNTVLSTVPAGDLVGQAVECFGYGANTTGGNTEGVRLRSSQQTVVAADENVVTLAINASDQIGWRGDSGSPCFYTDSVGKLRQVGLLRGVDDIQNPTLAYYVSSEGIAEWVKYYLLEASTDVLGFETLDAWETGVGHALSSDRTEQQTSLAVFAQNQVRMDSPSLGPVPVEPKVRLDISLPVNQANPYWYGNLALRIRVPSKGIDKQIGQEQLMGLPLGEFQTVEMDVPADVVDALQDGDYSDLSLSVILNVPYNQTGEYLIDNLRFVQAERLTVRPVLFLPSDAIGELTAAEIEQARDLLNIHFRIAQQRYRILLGTDTFHFEVPEDLVYESTTHSVADYMNASGADGDTAHLMTRHLLQWQGETRDNSKQIFVSLMVRPAAEPCGTDGRACQGGGRTFNGDPGTGGGFIGFEYDSLLSDFPYPFQSTLQHELGHTFGLVHIKDSADNDLDCYFLQPLALSDSIMGYNPTHLSSGTTESATPGIFEPEELFLLDLNHPAFPNFSFVDAVHGPAGRALLSDRIAVCRQGAMGPEIEY